MKNKYIQQVTKSGYPKVDRLTKQPVYHVVSGSQEMAPVLLLDRLSKAFKYRMKTFLNLGYVKGRNTKLIQEMIYNGTV